MVNQYDLGATTDGDLARALAGTRARFLVVAISSDWLFPPEQQHEIARALVLAGRHTSFFQVETESGHDGFLLSYEIMSAGVSAFLAAQNEPPSPVTRDVWHEQDAEAICDMVAPCSRVLDVGSGTGRMMQLLQRRNQATGMCIDNNFEAVRACMRLGLPALQLDASKAMSMLPSGLFDYVLLNQSIQQLGFPLLVLEEMLRIAP
eukprot:UC1_evm1s1042